MKTEHPKLTSHEALQALEDGNRRFQANISVNRDLLEQVNRTAGGQHPFAVILSCIDSRTSAELIFDQGIGDIFSIRIAGNVLNEDILGSMEFACKLAGSSLIVVLGHSACGAVKGACADAELGHLTGLLSKIRPAIERAEQSHDRSHDQFVQVVAENNVEHVVGEIRARSTVLDEMINNGAVGLVGAMYSVQTGEIEFKPMQCGNRAIAASQ
jgi:carbonic anhydrase